MEPYFRPAAAAAADLALSWHPVSQESLTEPQVSAATIRTYCIDPSIPRRPRAKDVQLEVTAGGAFFTVHEYVSVAVLWLMGMRETLLDVLGKNEGNPSAAVLHEAGRSVPWPQGHCVLAMRISGLAGAKGPAQSWRLTRGRPRTRSTRGESCRE
ncbi:hypothetical protein CDEST_00351 [Colletotrichum destructivum]|uniref:Uncharacterized protein n=1 Tax=Colletotrichum destructivum TaxID=34406 RepID=A0AAX4HW82_9PEZI|nr:hypothetical protein CDEST_00351 [Colletotrichum destructivum]